MHFQHFSKSACFEDYLTVFFISIDSSLDQDYTLLLASGDELGNVMIWNVLDGIAELHLIDTPASAVINVCWHPSNPFLILTLRDPNIFTLWDIKKGRVVWRKIISEGEPIIRACFDPFSSSTLQFCSRRGRVYRMPEVDKPPNVVLQYQIPSGLTDMCFSLTERDIMIFVLPREMLIFDAKSQAINWWLLSLSQFFQSEQSISKSKPAFDLGNTRRWKCNCLENRFEIFVLVRASSVLFPFHVF